MSNVDFKESLDYLIGKYNIDFSKNESKYRFKDKKDVDSDYLKDVNLTYKTASDLCGIRINKLNNEDYFVYEDRKCKKYIMIDDNNIVQSKFNVIMHA